MEARRSPCRHSRLAKIRARGYRGSLRTCASIPLTCAASGQGSTAATGSFRSPAHRLDHATGRHARRDRPARSRTACAACPELAALTELAHGFNELVRTRGGARLEEWIKQATDSPFPEARGFAKGLYGDFDAVKAGLTLEWSSGKVEGNITRVILWCQQFRWHSR